MESESYSLPALPLYDDSSSPPLSSYSSIPSVSPFFPLRLTLRSKLLHQSLLVSEATVRPIPVLPDERSSKYVGCYQEPSDGLQHGQLATNNMLDDLRHHPLTDNSELQGKLDTIENLLNRVLGQTHPPPPSVSSRKHTTA
jgi:hypothetical protein